jgi:hypothetical protein
MLPDDQKGVSRGQMNILELSSHGNREDMCADGGLESPVWPRNPKRS